MARPRKAIKRDQQLNFSLTQPELAAIYAFAAEFGMSLMEYGRWRLLTHPGNTAAPERVAPRVDPALRTELRRIGVNLNQMMRFCHATRQSPPPTLYPLLEAIRDLLSLERPDDRQDRET